MNGDCVPGIHFDNAHSQKISSLFVKLKEQKLSKSISIKERMASCSKNPYHCLWQQDSSRLQTWTQMDRWTFSFLLAKIRAVTSTFFTTSSFLFVEAGTLQTVDLSETFATQTQISLWIFLMPKYLSASSHPIGLPKTLCPLNLWSRGGAADYGQSLYGCSAFCHQIGRL